MKKLLAYALATFILSACGGGGSSSVPATSKSGTQSKVTGSVVISIPIASSTIQSVGRSVRYPQFVSPNASSVEMNVNGGSDTNFDVSPTSSLCVTIPTSGARNCTLTFGAPVGSDTFGFLIFSGANGTGTQLASATTVQTIAGGTAFNFTVAMNAAVGTVVANVVGSSQGNCPGYGGNGNSNTINEGCAGMATASLTVMDPSGTIVTGTAPYASSIVISASDPSLSASPNTITAPGQTSTFTYNGAAFAPGVTTSITFDLTVSGVAIPVSVPVRRSYLYVANSNAPIGTTPVGGGNVAVYTFGASGTSSPTRLITSVSTPTKVISDNTGNAYVLDNGIPISGNFNANIYVFAPGATGGATPIRTISGMATLTNQPCSDMIFDPTGAFLFVACGSEIQVFPVTASGVASSVVSTQMQDDAAVTQAGLAFDPSDNLWISDDAGNVIFYIPAPVPTSGAFHNISGPNVMQPPSSWPSTVNPFYMVFDNPGTLYAPFFYQNATPGAPDAAAELGIWNTNTLPCTNCGPSATLVNAPFSTHAVGGIALDAADNVYVANIFTDQISEISHATASGASIGTTATIMRTLNNSGSGQATGPLGLWVGP